LKEVAIGNMPSKHSKQEDERKIFDFIQEWPYNNDNDPDIDMAENGDDASSNSSRPVLALQRFES
jgi:hypothetical protein